MCSFSEALVGQGSRASGLHVFVHNAFEISVDIVFNLYPFLEVIEGLEHMLRRTIK